LTKKKPPPVELPSSMFHYHLYPEHQQRMKRTLVEEEENRPTLFGGLGSMLELGYQPSSIGTTATAVASAVASTVGSVVPSPAATVAAIETNSLPCFTTYCS